MGQCNEEEYYPALEACYSLLADESYLQTMKVLFNQPENIWLNVRKDWLDIQELEFYTSFKNELSVFDITLDDFNDLSVMWSTPPSDQSAGMYLVLFFNAKNFIVNSCLYNYQYLMER
ncbi:hypothetical protein [Acinetobacter sp. ESBL14]|uniref:hypothetical protein n=1 Tax=Acinetobacter sp. ESBL14 TaxID=3077329 RepID=UPI002FC891F0